MSTSEKTVLQVNFYLDIHLPVRRCRTFWALNADGKTLDKCTVKYAFMIGCQVYFYSTTQILAEIDIFYLPLIHLQIMTPDEVVLQLKRNGTFDDLRKRLLSEFQSGVCVHL
jgi:hypothetical protein